MFNFLKQVLEIPVFYELSQTLLGGRRVVDVLQNVIAGELNHVRSVNVLEVGCGTGLTRRCFSGAYTGLDINHAYVRIAKQAHSGNFLVASADCLPFPGDAYDVVATVGVLHHLGDQARRAMLQEMLRVCKQNGVVVIADGLVPSNRLNVLGYLLAKLDCGPYKMRLYDFQRMITTAYPDSTSLRWATAKSFPGEYVVVVRRKASA